MGGARGTTISQKAASKILRAQGQLATEDKVALVNPKRFKAQTLYGTTSGVRTSPKPRSASGYTSGKMDSIVGKVRISESISPPQSLRLQPKDLFRNWQRGHLCKSFDDVGLDAQVQLS